MSQHFVAGFEAPYTSGVDHGFSGTFGGRVASGGAFGGAYWAGPGGVVFIPFLSNISTTGWIGYCFKIASVGTAIFEVTDVTTVQLRVRATASGGGFKLEVTRGAGVATLGTGSSVLSFNTWYFCELEYIIHPSTGVAKIWIDNNAETGLQLTGQNTRQSGNSYGNRLYSWADEDDTYIYDDQGSDHNSRPGPMRFVYRTATSEGADTAGVANSGTKVSRITDATTDDDTSYYSLASAGDKEGFNPVALPAAATVTSLKRFTRVRRDDAGPTTWRSFLRNSTPTYQNETTETAAATYVTKSYEHPNSLFNPGNLWTKAEIDALQFGVEKVS